MDHLTLCLFILSITLVVLFFKCYSLLYRQDTYPIYDEIHNVKSSSLVIVLKKLSYKQTPKGGVILIPGLYLNDSIFIFGGNLVHFLKQNGFDVWTLSFYKKRPSSIKEWEECIYCAINYIDSINNGLPLFAIGYSLGGYILYKLQKEYPQLRVKKIIGISSPLSLKSSLKKLQWLLLLEHRLRYLPMINTPKLVLLSMLPFIGIYYPKIARLFFNPYNVSSKLLKLVVVNSIEIENKTLLRELLAYLNNKVGEDNNTVRENNLPVTIIGGSWDNITTVSSLLDNDEKVKVKIFGRGFGSNVNYGHLDIIVGETVPSEIYPFILRELTIN